MLLSVTSERGDVWAALLEDIYQYLELARLALLPMDVLK